MQLRGHTYDAIEEPLELTNKVDLQTEIECCKSIIAANLSELGIESLEVTTDNIEDVADLLSPHLSFILGRLITLVQLNKELFYNEDRILPWFKKPENN
jgi:hypothetical protein